MTLPDRLPHDGPTLVAARPGSRRAAIRCGGATHRGVLRDHNEDRLHVDPERGLLIVVDGIGGQAAGGIAAETALTFLRSRLERQTGRVEERVREAIAVANNEIVRLAAQNPEWSGMGCVLTLAVIEDGMVTVGHVGDSRAYRLGADGIVKVTRDHSPIGEREDEGELSEAAAMRHPRRNEVYRSVGAEEHTPQDEEFVEVSRFPFDPEGAILLCSDGLTDLVSSESIARIVREHAGDEQRAVERLIEAANAAGGKDNVTVALAAGDRFAAALGARREHAEGRRDLATETQVGSTPRPWLSRPGYVLALGALAGTALFWGFTLLDRGPASPRSPLGPALQTSRAPRALLVGPGLEFAGIGDALAAARSGDTVLVAPGIYREQVRLEEGVTLMSRLPRQAVLAPRGEGAAPLVAIVAEGLSAGRIAGFRVAASDSGPLDIGIRVRDARIAIEDVEVSGARIAGVVFQGRGEAALRASLIHRNAGAGVTITSPATPRLGHNLILDNGRSAPRARAGVELEGTPAPALVGNVIAGNAAEGVRGAPPALRAALLENNIFEAFGRVNGSGAFGVARARGRR
ncbi:MAG: protein phosphatase 2C domain-containing protein [Candidatus Eisenbacteria bacterium]